MSSPNLDLVRSIYATWVAARYRQDEASLIERPAGKDLTPALGATARRAQRPSRNVQT